MSRARDTANGLARTVQSGVIVDASISSSADISQSKINDLIDDLSGKSSLSGATFTGTVTGLSPTSEGSAGFRKITMSTSAPSGGADGDVWLQYS